MSFAAADVVRAVFLACFGGAPDDSQLQSMLAQAGDDPAALEALARRLHLFRQKLEGSKAHAVPDHSQFGEFGILLNDFAARAASHRIVVDVGAHGRDGSNSYDLLVNFGWRGLLVEANPALLPRIRLEFGSADYQLVGCAVGVEPGQQKLHLFENHQLSSLLPGHVEHWSEAQGSVEVEVRRLPDILAEHGIPADFDLLSLDIEGLDAAVLNDLIAMTPYRPRWIIVEVAMPFEQKTIEGLGLSDEVLGLYELVDRTIANLILRLR